MDRHEINRRVGVEANWMHRHASELAKAPINESVRDSAMEVVRLVEMMRESSTEMRVMLVKRALGNMLELEDHIRDGIFDRFNDGRLDKNTAENWIGKSVSRKETFLKKLDEWEHGGEADKEEEAWR